MVDLETLGSVPGCSIVAIGAVACTYEGHITDEFYVVVSSESCRVWGLHEDQDTLAWWGRQSPEAQAVLVQADDPEASHALLDALRDFNEFVKRQPGRPLVYGNGSDFDNAILATAARAAGTKLAWPFWQNACYRTEKRKAPWIKLERTGTAHNALDDARSQAEHLVRLLRAQQPDVDTASAVLRFAGWLADRYQERTSRSFFGVRYGGMSRVAARAMAAATLEASVESGVLRLPPTSWTRDDADDLVDKDMRHWDAA